MNNLRKYLKENNIKRSDLLEVFNANSEQTISNKLNGIIKVKDLKIWQQYTKLTYSQLLDRELLFRTFIFRNNPDIEKIITINVNDIIKVVKLDLTYLTIDYRAILRKSNNNHEKCIERQEFLFKLIRKILKDGDVEFKVDWR